MKPSVLPVLLILAVGFGALLPTSPLMAQSSLPTESYYLDQCAIVQPGDHPKVYLTASSGEVEAVNVPTGKILWHTAKASFPLLARGNRLLVVLPVAQGKTVCDLGLLDIRNGNLIKRLACPPDQAFSPPGESLGDSYHIQGITQDGRDVAVWTHTWHPTPGGAYKGPDFVYPLGSSGQKQGLLVVDVAGGNILPPSGSYPNLSLRGQNNPWGGWTTEPFVVDGVTVQAESDMIDKQQLLILRRWKGIDALPEVRLGDPPWNSSGVVVTADHRQVLGVYQLPNKSQIQPNHLEDWVKRHYPDSGLPDQNGGFLYHLEVYSSSTGKKISEMDATSWPTVAELCGTDLVCFWPNRVFAMDITNGKEVWTQTVKDLTYRGPYPPSAAHGRSSGKSEENE